MTKECQLTKSAISLLLPRTERRQSQRPNARRRIKDDNWAQSRGASSPKCFRATSFLFNLRTTRCKLPLGQCEYRYWGPFVSQVICDRGKWLHSVLSLIKYLVSPPSRIVSSLCDCPDLVPLGSKRSIGNPLGKQNTKRHNRIEAIEDRLCEFIIILW